MTPEEKAREIVNRLVEEATTADTRVGSLVTDWDMAESIIAIAIREARNAALEEAAKICDEQSAIFSCDTYAVDQPISSIGERFACGQIKEDILALKDKPARDIPEVTEEGGA